jgi:hypothetical protein
MIGHLRNLLSLLPIFLLKALVPAVLLGGLVLLLIYRVPALPSVPEHDDTDNPPYYSRLNPHTDALIGCQYLTFMFGGLVPRFDANGKQLGCRQ